MTFLLEIVDFSFQLDLVILMSVTVSLTRKNCQMSIKVAQNDFTRKMIDFDNLTKIA